MVLVFFFFWFSVFIEFHDCKINYFPFSLLPTLWHSLSVPFWTFSWKTMVSRLVSVHRWRKVENNWFNSLVQIVSLWTGFQGRSWSVGMKRLLNGALEGQLEVCTGIISYKRIICPFFLISSSDCTATSKYPPYPQLAGDIELAPNYFCSTLRMIAILIYGEVNGIPFSFSSFRQEKISSFE